MGFERDVFIITFEYPNIHRRLFTPNIGIPFAVMFKVLYHNFRKLSIHTHQSQEALLKAQQEKLPEVYTFGSSVVNKKVMFGFDK